MWKAVNLENRVANYAEFRYDVFSSDRFSTRQSNPLPQLARESD